MLLAYMLRNKAGPHTVSCTIFNNYCECWKLVIISFNSQMKRLRLSIICKKYERLWWHSLGLTSEIFISVITIPFAPLCFLCGASQSISIIMWYYSNWAEEIPDLSSFSYVQSYLLSEEESASILTCFVSLGDLFSQHRCEQTREPNLCILCSGQGTLSASSKCMYIPPIA